VIRRKLNRASERPELGLRGLLVVLVERGCLAVGLTLRRRRAGIPYVKKKKARFFRMGPPADPLYVEFTLSNFTRSSDVLGATSDFVEFCVPVVVGGEILQRPLEPVRARLGDDVHHRARPAAVFHTDRRRPDDHLLDASKFRFAPNVPVVGSVVFTPSNMKMLLLERAVRIDVTGADHAVTPISVIVPADGELAELFHAHVVSECLILVSTMGVEPVTVVATSTPATFSVTERFVVRSASTMLSVSVVV
jgi:hypothetical protein